MSITTQLQDIIQDAASKLGINVPQDIHLEHPRELSHGDYATNIAMVLAKAIDANPHELAERIAAHITEQHHPDIHSVTVAGPGFINISLSQDFFSRQVQDVLRKGDTYGNNTSWQGKRILVEHSSPNLFKPFHIGHMMNNAIGEAIARLCKTTGANVVTIAYPSDVSLGIGKAVWKLLDYGIDSLNEYRTLSEKVQFLGRCYAEGTEALKSHPELESRIREITQDIYEQRDTEAYRAYLLGKDLNLEYFKEMTHRLGSSFDDFVFESETGIVGKNLVLQNTPAIYTESNEAVVYKGEKDGLHTRVFINADGNPTYEAKDTGFLNIKFERYHPDMSVFVTDHEQGPYFQVVIAAAGKINRQWQEKTVHKTHGRMQFKGQKMSSRLGNTPIVSDILDTVADEVRQRTEDKPLNEHDRDIIAIGAIKYVILRTQAGKNINFDPDTSLSFEGDSGPYLQYTYARARSVLRRAKKKGVSSSQAVPDTWETTDVERLLYRYPETLEAAFKELQPHLVVNYVTELAQVFNSWYGNTKIIDNDNRMESAYKLTLTEATAQIIKNALSTLGIETLEQM